MRVNAPSFHSSGLRFKIFTVSLFATLGFCVGSRDSSHQESNESRHSSHHEIQRVKKSNEWKRPTQQLCHSRGKIFIQSRDPIWVKWSNERRDPMHREIQYDQEIQPVKRSNIDSESSVLISSPSWDAINVEPLFLSGKVVYARMKMGKVTRRTR